MNDINVNNININENNNNNKNYNKNFNNKFHKDYYCHIYRTKGHSTDHYKYNLLIKERNKSDINDNKNYKFYSKKDKNSSKRYHKNNYHSSNIIDNNENEDNKNNNNIISENNYEDEDEVYINFTGNISVIQNCSNTTIKNYINSTYWIIDSGTGINITNNKNNLNNLSKINNKNIIYPNGNLDKVKNVSTYKGKFKNNNFVLSNVYYASNIQNNLISTHSILENACNIIMKRVNNKDHLRIYKNNNLITNIVANEENLFSFDTVPTNNIITKNYVNNIDTNLWHARLGHYFSNNIKDYIIYH